MDIEEMTGKLQSAGAWVPEKKVKLDFGGNGIIVLDGVGKTISRDDQDADTTIKVDYEDWKALGAGQLDPMTAFMSGKIKIEGDMANAMQLQGVLAKLQG